MYYTYFTIVTQYVSKYPLDIKINTYHIMTQVKSRITTKYTT